MNLHWNKIAVFVAVCSLFPGNIRSQDYYLLTYNSENGGLALDIPAGLPQLTTLELTSPEGYFTGTRPNALTNQFDVFTAHKLFKLEPDGFGGRWM